MGDVLLSALLGSAQIQSVATSTPTTGQTQNQVPAEIANLPQGSLIKGFVVNRDAQNNPILRTNLGDVLVKSEVFLKTGSEVVIRVNNNAGQVNARIVSVDSVPIQDVIQQQQGVKQGDQVLQSSLVSKSSAPQPATNQPINAPLLQGVLLQPAQFGSEQQSLQTIASILRLPPQLAMQLNQGLNLQFRVVGGDLNVISTLQTQTNPSQTTPSATSATPSAAATTTPSGSAISTQYGAYSKLSGTQPFTSLNNPLNAPALQTPANPATAQPTTVNAAIQATAAQQSAMTQNPISTTTPPVTTPLPNTPSGNAAPLPSPPAATAPATPSPASPPIQSAPPTTPIPLAPESATRAGTLTARVIGNEPDGGTILRTSIGTIKLYTASPPPLNSTLKLELVPNFPQQPHANTATQPTTNTNQPAISLASQYAHQWDSLEQSFQLLRHDAPAQAAELASRVPNTKSKMVNGVLFFLSALNSGDMRRWLGTQTTSKIEESDTLMKRLGNDFTNLRTLSTDKPDMNWQMLFFPLMHEDELHMAQLYVRRDGGEGNEASGEENRFLLAVNLSEIGVLQIDGLMHRAGNTPVLDIVIRSETSLEDEMKDEIRGIYREASEAAGFHGQLRFAHGFQNLLNPVQEIHQQTQADDGSIIA